MKHSLPQTPATLAMHLPASKSALRCVSVLLSWLFSGAQPIALCLLPYALQDLPVWISPACADMHGGSTGNGRDRGGPR